MSEPLTTDPVASLRRLNNFLEETADLMDLGHLSHEVAAEIAGQIADQLNAIKERLLCM